MNSEKARSSPYHLHNHVTKDTAELRKLSKMPKATFYRNLKKLTQQGTINRKHGSGRLRALNKNDEESNCRKTPWSPLKLTWQRTGEVQISRSINISKSTLFPTRRKKGIKRSKNFHNSSVASMHEERILNHFLPNKNNSPN